MTIQTNDTASDTQSDLDLDGLMNLESEQFDRSAVDFGDDFGDDVAPAPAPEPEVEEATDAPAEEPAEPAVEEEPPAEVAGEEDGADDAPTDAPADPEPAADHDDGAKSRQKEPAIPKSRFDQRTAQLRAAERRAQELEEKLRVAQAEQEQRVREANTLSDEQLQQKMAEANTAVIEGDTDKAAALQAEVFRALRASSAPASAAEPIDRNQIIAEVREGMEFERVVKDTFTRFPQLDTESESYNEELSVEAVAMQKMYFDQGYDRIEATRRAADAIAKIHGLADTSAPAPAAERPSAKVAAAQKTQQANRQAKVAAAQKAPPAAAGNSGAQRDTGSEMSIHDVTPEDWEALPASVRSRLLGDTL